MAKHHKLLKTKGPDGATIGYFVRGLYRFGWSRVLLKLLGFSYVKDLLTGWTFWWIDNEDDYVRIMTTIDELRKTRKFIYKVGWYSD